MVLIAGQDEMHIIFECQHNALCALCEQYEELFAAPAHGSTPAQSLFLFMNQRDVLSVAKFVQQLQSLMDTLLRAPTDDSTTRSFLWFALFCHASFSGYSPVGFVSM
jgi:hypothetical protein